MALLFSRNVPCMKVAISGSRSEMKQNKRSQGREAMKDMQKHFNNISDFHLQTHV